MCLLKTLTEAIILIHQILLHQVTVHHHIQITAITIIQITTARNQTPIPTTIQKQKELQPALLLRFQVINSSLLLI